MMTAAIQLLRLTSAYVTLGDIHEIITNNDFLADRLKKLTEIEDQYPEFDVNQCKNYFSGEFYSKAENMIESIKGCVTEMTGFFASSERIHETFCPKMENLTFTGFEELINEGKIVILAMNAAKYPEVSKTIAAYLKLDFQSEVQQRINKTQDLSKARPVFFFCDEYQEFVTANDARFYALSRESKCASIVSTQSYSSILQTLGTREHFDTLQQNLVNKIWLRTDDRLTIDTAQFLTGKEENERLFKRDFVFDEKIFTQVLEVFTAVCFTANEKGMNEPSVVHLLPYFTEPVISMSAAKAGPVKIRLSAEAGKSSKSKYMIKMSKRD